MMIAICPVSALFVSSRSDPRSAETIAMLDPFSPSRKRDKGRSEHMANLLLAEKNYDASNGARRLSAQHRSLSSLERRAA